MLNYIVSNEENSEEFEISAVKIVSDIDGNRLELNAKSSGEERELVTELMSNTLAFVSAMLIMQQISSKDTITIEQEFVCDKVIYNEDL